MRVRIDESIKKTITVEEENSERVAFIDEHDGEFQGVSYEGLQRIYNLEDWVFLGIIASTIQKFYTKEGFARARKKNVKEK